MPAIDLFEPVEFSVFKDQEWIKQLEREFPPEKAKAWLQEQIEKHGGIAEAARALRPFVCEDERVWVFPFLFFLFSYGVEGEI